MNNNSLDLSEVAFKAMLDKSRDLVLNQFEDLEHKKAYHYYPQQEIASWFEENLPERGMNELELLEEVKQKVLDPATGNLGPHMYAYVMAGGTQLSIIAEQLAATINQNIGKWHLAPSISEIENALPNGVER